MTYPTPWHGKRVLVTGGTGFIGANLVRRLLAEEACVFVLARDASVSWRLEDIGDRISVMSGDLTRFTDVKAVMAQVRPAVVFHLATARVGKETMNYTDYVAVNTLGTHHLMNAAHEVGVERMVYAGSQLEYGPSLKPHCELDILQPNTYHGMTKGAATVFLQEMGKRVNPSVAILRLFHVYGPWESPKRLIPTAARAALNGDLLRMTQKGFRRDYVYVEDVVDAFLMAAERTDLVSEIFNIGSGFQTSNEKVIGIIEGLAGKPLTIEFDAYAAHLTDTTFRVANIEKAAKILGWQPQYDLESGLRATLAWVTGYDREREKI